MRGLTVTPSTSPYRAEGDKLFAYAQYNDVTGSLTVGMPVYLDVRDSAEFNVQYTTTSLPASSVNYNMQTPGNVVLGTTSAGTGSTLTCMGVYAPTNPSVAPANGSIIRVLVQGRGLVAVSVHSGATAATVGVKLIASASYTGAVPGTAAVGQVIGTITATGSATASTNSIFAVPGAGTTVGVLNAYVSLC